MQFRTLVFPAPFGPMRASSSPPRTSIVSPEREVTPPKRSVRSESSRMARSPAADGTAPLLSTGSSLWRRPEENNRADAPDGRARRSEVRGYRSGCGRARYFS